MRTRQVTRVSPVTGQANVENSIAASVQVVSRNCISSGLAVKPWSKRQEVGPACKSDGSAPGTVKDVFFFPGEPVSSEYYG